MIVAAEIRKLGTLPAARYALVVVVVLGASIAWLFAAAATQPDAGRAGVTDIALRSMDVAPAALLVFGVIAIAGEYPAVIRTTLVVAPQRWRVFAAKALTVVVYALPASLATVGAMYAIAWSVVGHERDMDIGALLSAAAYLVLLALMAFAIGLVLRRTLAGTGVVLGYFFVAGPLVRMYTETSWTPDAAGIALWAPKRLPDAIGTGDAWLILTAWTVGLLALAAVVFQRRDA